MDLYSINPKIRSINLRIFISSDEMSLNEIICLKKNVKNNGRLNYIDLLINIKNHSTIMELFVQ